MKIVLSNGFELDNLTLNGNNFISQTEINKEIFANNLSQVTVIDGHNTRVMYKCKLVQIKQYGDEWWFILDEMTDTEITLREQADAILELADIVGGML